MLIILEDYWDLVFDITCANQRKGWGKRGWEVDDQCKSEPNITKNNAKPVPLQTYDHQKCRTIRGKIRVQQESDKGRSNKFSTVAQGSDFSPIIHHDQKQSWHYRCQKSPDIRVFENDA